MEHNLHVEACDFTYAGKKDKKKCGLQKLNYAGWLHQAAIGKSELGIAKNRNENIYE